MQVLTISHYWALSFSFSYISPTKTQLDYLFFFNYLYRQKFLNLNQTT